MKRGGGGAAGAERGGAASAASIAPATALQDTWALMLAGIGGIGLMLRRARKTAGGRSGNAAAA